MCSTTRLTHLLLWCLSAGAMSACDQSDHERAPVRTEPWRRDQGGDPTKKAHTFKYRIEPGAQLDVALPTRRALPHGTFKQVQGELVIDVDQLQFLKGHVEVDLSSLHMDDGLTLPPIESTKLDASLYALLTSETWTTHAQNWLGLGTLVLPVERATSARFVIESAKDLSHPRAHMGASRLLPPDRASYKHARVIHASAVGSLTLRHRTVARTLDVVATFYYNTKASSDATPQALDVQIRGKWDVPIAEYDVRPRDAAGHEQSALGGVVGQLVGGTAQITGTLPLKNVPFEPD